MRFSALLLGAVAALSPMASHAAVVVAPVDSARLTMDIQSGPTNIYIGNAVFTAPVVWSGDTWAARATGAPSPTLHFSEQGSDNPGEIENQTTAFGSITYHFRIGTADEAAYLAAFNSGYLTIDGFVDLLTPNTTFNGDHTQADVGIFSSYDPYGMSTSAYSFYASCGNGYGEETCGRTRIGDQVLLAQFADAATQSFTGTVVLAAQMRAGRFGAGRDNFITIDPVLGITGLGLNQSNYAIRVSDGMGNGAAAAVPEPASWAMMIVGFGLVGAGMRRKAGAGKGRDAKAALAS